MAIGTPSEVQIAPQAGVSARLSARLRARALDEGLARGIPPETAPPLALRARRLTALSRRRTIADGLERVVGDTCRRPSQRRVSPRSSEVIAASDELTRLAESLARPGPVGARGVAQAWILLTDGTGPLYNVNSPANLRSRARSAAENLRVED